MCSDVIRRGLRDIRAISRSRSSPTRWSRDDTRNVMLLLFVSELRLLALFAVVRRRRAERRSAQERHASDPLRRSHLRRHPRHPHHHPHRHLHQVPQVRLQQISVTFCANNGAPIFEVHFEYVRTDVAIISALVATFCKHRGQNTDLKCAQRLCDNCQVVLSLIRACSFLPARMRRQTSQGEPAGDAA